MPLTDPSNQLTRRTFLSGAAKTGLAAGAAMAAPGMLTAAARAQSAPRPGMNILFIIVDQMRTPWVYLPPKLQRRAMPTITALAGEGVRFSNFFTASNMCTPSRAVQATGLYTHQTAIFATTPPTDLNPGFPTFGSMLRANGYDTYWFGKWHLSGDQLGNCEPEPYERYGFTADWPGSGTCPSPNGGAGEGLAMDPLIRQQFIDWLRSRPANEEKPWAATVSLVNPHDIAWYPRFTRFVEGQSSAPKIFHHLPANYETAREREEREKPEMQRRAQQIENELFGFMPDDRSRQRLWTKMLDTYLLMHQQVDVQLSLVLKALAQSPWAHNTVVIFTSDHGEYAGAHGMRGKGFGFYEEGVRVPLVVKDPSGTWTKAIRQDRKQLASSADLAALMLTIATGGNDWRGDSDYAQIASRADIASILRDPEAPGRAYVAYATDEPGTTSQIPTTQQLKPAPNHITGVRTPHGKFARYAFWKDGGNQIDESRPVQYEAYDYGTRNGRRELDNVYRRRRVHRHDRALVRRLESLLDKAMEEEIQATLPAGLQPVQDQAYQDWFSQPPGEFTWRTDN
jgi:arylsulfatase A-like enzyme